MRWHVVSEHALETGIIDAAPSGAHPDKSLFKPIALEVWPEVNAAFVPALRLHVVAQAQVQLYKVQHLLDARSRVLWTMVLRCSTFSSAVAVAHSSRSTSTGSFTTYSMASALAPRTFPPSARPLDSE
eukprot:scaffold20361_cov102-Isochrysis_galbana.AAC.15